MYIDGKLAFLLARLVDELGSDAGQTGSKQGVKMAAGCFLMVRVYARGRHDSCTCH